MFAVHKYLLQGRSQRSQVKSWNNPLMCSVHLQLPHHNSQCRLLFYFFKLHSVPFHFKNLFDYMRNIIGLKDFQNMGDRCFPPSYWLYYCFLCGWNVATRSTDLPLLLGNQNDLYHNSVVEHAEIIKQKKKIWRYRCISKSKTVVEFRKWNLGYIHSLHTVDDIFVLFNERTKFTISSY